MSGFGDQTLVVGTRRTAGGTNGCPECGGVGRQLDTRHPPGRVTRRRRECPDCDHRWTTFEVDAETYELMLNLVNRVDDVREALLRAIAALEATR